MTILEAALEYQAKGYSVIPVTQDKKPLIKWEAHQQTRATSETIRQWWKEHPKANIGLVTGAISNLLVVDCDTPEAIQRIQEALPDSLLVPCESTPRGGMHFFFSHSEGFVNRARVAGGIDVRTTGGYVAVAPSVNGTGKGWKWIVSIHEVDPPEIALAVKEILISNSLFYRESTKSSQQLSTLSTFDNILFQEGRRDEDLFHVANHLVKGGMQQQEISQVLRIIMDSWGEGFDEQWRHTKIDSALKRAERKERNLTEEVKEWILSESCQHSVVFMSTDCRSCLHLSTREEEKTLSVILKRFVDQGLIEKHGEKRGCFRIKEEGIQEINWEDCDDTVIDVQWPFELHKLYTCLPKNIIIIAGSPDAGKTAFCLNFAMLNMDRFQIKYFSSEMGALELKVRLKKFNFPLKRWKAVKFIERSSNFPDVIEPDGINIVDYIEVPEEAWKIATPINEIFRKLNKGICIIALQKPLGRDVARGGESTLDRPRLYLSMGKGVIKIIKCKNWANESLNPNGLSREYKIAGGHNFTYQSEWGIPWEETTK